MNNHHESGDEYGRNLQAEIDRIGAWMVSARKEPSSILVSFTTIYSSPPTRLLHHPVIFRLLRGSSEYPRRCATISASQPLLEGSSNSPLQSSTSEMNAHKIFAEQLLIRPLCTHNHRQQTDAEAALRVAAEGRLHLIFEPGQIYDEALAVLRRHQDMQVVMSFGEKIGSAIKAPYGVTPPFTGWAWNDKVQLQKFELGQEAREAKAATVQERTQL